MTFQPINSKTAFLPTTEVFPKDESQRLIKQTSNYTDIAQAVNVREIALYQDTQPVITGQQFSDPGNAQKKKYTFRTMYYFGAIAAGATLNIPHEIKNLFQLTHAYGTCVIGNDFTSIPHVSTVALDEQISMEVTATDIEIINGAGGPNITSGIIVLEYLLN